MSRITRRQDPIVQRLRRLAMRRGSDLDVLLDGEHVIADALAAGVPIELVLTDGRARETALRAGASGATVYECTTPVLQAASPVRTPSGIVAIARWQPVGLDAALAAPQALVLGLVDVQDPGNAGSAIRSADALGATGVLALDQTADPGGWKVLRGSMGSAFRLIVARGSSTAAVGAAHARGLRLIVMTPSDGTPVDAVDFTRPSLVLVGNEGAGLPANLAALADERATIPMRAGVDSLNVAATAAVVLHEARRQRQRAMVHTK